MGNMLSRKLVAEGYRVFAGVLPGIATDLEPTERLILLEQDVSDPDSVRSSAAEVSDRLGNEALHVVMNVAGVANICQGTIEGLKLEELEKIFAVNSFGAVAVCQAFLPRIRQAGQQGRIFNFGSAAVYGNPPVMGAYSMSKHALHGLTRTLRLELAPWGTQVTSIWPGVVKTAMVENPNALTAANWAAQSVAAQQAYGPYLHRGYCERLPEVFEKFGNPTDEVTDSVMRLLNRKKLKPQYLIGKKDAQWLGPLHDWLPNSWFEAMMRHTYQIPTSRTPRAK